jgi:hypothetical protein
MANNDYFGKHTMKTILTVFTILIAISSFSQENLFFPIARKENGHFDFAQIEKKVTKTEVDHFMKNTPEEFPFYKQEDDENIYHNTDSLRKKLHFIDLNNDGLNDVLFEGENSGEATQVCIFIRTGEHYKNVFSGFEGIAKVEWKDRKLSRLYIDNWGCCDDYLYYQEIYNVSYNKSNLPVFKKVSQGLSVDNGKIPDSLLKTPFQFEVLNEGYKIRTGPVIDDSSLQPWNDYPKETGSGNTIGKLVKGTTGTAFARMVDKTGREWLFVQIDEAYLPKNKIISLEDNFPTKLIGWISSRYIKVKDE